MHYYWDLNAHVTTELWPVAQSEGATYLQHLPATPTCNRVRLAAKPPVAKSTAAHGITRSSPGASSPCPAALVTLMPTTFPPAISIDRSCKQCKEG